MAVTFRCKRSGNTVTFTLPEDIESTRKNESYVEVKVDEPQKSADVKNELLQEILQKAEARKPGRPKKVA